MTSTTNSGTRALQVFTLSIAFLTMIGASGSAQTPTKEDASQKPSPAAENANQVPTIVRAFTPDSGPRLGVPLRPGTNAADGGTLGYINMQGTDPTYGSEFGLFMGVNSGLYMGARLGGNYSNTAFIFYNQASQEILRIRGDKSVAIGNQGPRSARLEVAGPVGTTDVIVASATSLATDPHGDAAQLNIMNTGTTNGNHARIDFGTVTSTTAYAPTLASIQAVFADHSLARPRTDLTFLVGDNMQERMRITSTGRVGIGVAVPAYALDVVGDAHFSGEVTGDTIVANYQDVAEWVPAGQAMPPGTVVVLNRARRNEVMPSSEAYDTTVAGVVSSQPGLILGRAGTSKAKIATSGRVRVRVDATKNPIAIGDLMVTSKKSGMAMKSEPIEISGRKFHQPGTIVGKALEPLASGEGEILVLLSLQ
jgi:hypothetical protein